MQDSQLGQAIRRVNKKKQKLCDMIRDLCQHVEADKVSMLTMHPDEGMINYRNLEDLKMKLLDIRYKIITNRMSTVIAENEINMARKDCYATWFTDVSSYGLVGEGQ